MSIDEAQRSLLPTQHLEEEEEEEEEDVSHSEDNGSSWYRKPFTSR